MHKYAYVEGDPIQLVDPSGNFGIAGFAVGASIGANLQGLKVESDLFAFDLTTNLLHGIQSQQTVLQVFGNFAINHGIGLSFGFFAGLGSRGAPAIVDGVSEGISTLFAANGRSISRNARRGALDLSPIFNIPSFRSLERMRSELGLPAAGSSLDVFTLSRLDVDGRSFFGISGGLPNADGVARTLQQMAADLGPKGPTFQLIRHAEGDALVQAFNSGVGNGKRATLYVDRTPCTGCKSGFENMRKLMGFAGTCRRAEGWQDAPFSKDLA